MNWGSKIALVFILFAGIIIAMVIISLRQNVDLVAEDYYEQEIQYQQQIDRLQNSQQLKALPEFVYLKEQQQGILQFPEVLHGLPIEGSIYFFRPSDARLDREFKLDLNEAGRQTIGLEKLQSGFWKVKILWEQQGKEYYKEQSLNI